MKNLLYGDMRPYCNCAVHFVIRIFENTHANPISIGYAWGDAIDLGIQLPVADTALLHTIRIKARLLVKVSCIPNETGTTKEQQTLCIVRGSARHEHRLCLRDPYKINSTNSVIEIRSGSHTLVMSTDMTDWIKTLTFLAPIIP